MVATIRAFIAAAIPEPALDRVFGATAPLRGGAFRQIRWAARENVHLTLKFLGDVPADQMPRIRAVMEAAAAPFPGITLHARGYGVFPGIRRPRILWVGLGGDDRVLGSLQRELEKGLADIGFPAGSRPFRAHLTIGRIRAPMDGRKLGDALRALAGLETEPFRVERIHLMQSVLKPTGAEYTRLYSATLGG